MSLPDAAGAEASTPMRRNLSAPLAREASVGLAGGTGDSKSVFAALEDTPKSGSEGRTSVSDCGYGAPGEPLDEAIAERTVTRGKRQAKTHWGEKSQLGEESQIIC